MPHPPTPAKAATLGLALLLAALTLALYWPARTADFTWLDDDRYIVDNPPVLGGLTPANLRWACTTVHETWWAPLLWISYMADSTLHGTGPAGYRLTNFLLHAVNAALLFGLLQRMTRARGLAFFAAALFAFHPQRVESVVWIAERKDVLSGFFFLLALWAYLPTAARPAPGRPALVTLAMLGGLMSKSIVLVLPGLLLLLDYWPLRRAGDPWGRDAWPQWRPLLVEKTLWFALSIVFAVITLVTHRGVGTLGLEAQQATWLERLALIAPNYLDYLRQFAWPRELAILYMPRTPSPWLIAAAPLALLGTTVALGRWRRACPAAWVGWLWFLAAMLPLIRGIRFDEQSAYPDRYTYLPAIGLSLLVVWGAAGLARRWRAWTVPLLAAGLLALAACAARTRAYLPIWRDALAMFGHLVEITPDHPFAINNNGKALLEAGRAEEALPYFRHAMALHNTKAPGNYADALIRLDRSTEALAFLEHLAAETGSLERDWEALRGVALLNLDRPAEAIAPLQRALEFNPQSIGLQIALLRAQYEIDDAAGIAKSLRRLPELGYTPIRNFDGLIQYYVELWKGVHRVQAWHFFENNLRRRPEDVVLLNNTAWLLATTAAAPAPPAEALRLAQRAVELAPRPIHPGILDTLAAAQAANGDFAAALETAAQALGQARRDGPAAFVAELEKRIDTYRQKEPWREPPAP